MRRRRTTMPILSPPRWTLQTPAGETEWARRQETETKEREEGEGMKEKRDAACVRHVVLEQVVVAAARTAAVAADVHRRLLRC
jgi:hypothetical protein